MHRFFIFALLCFIALCAGVYMSLPHTEFSMGTFVPLQAQVDEEVPVAKTKIRFVGDVMLARNVEYLMDQYGVTYPLSMLPENPDNAYLVGNFESAIPVTHVPTKSMTFTFSVRPEHVQGLRSYGFTHLGLANNHAYDFGVDDYQNTYSVLQGSSFAPFGDPGGLASSTSVTIVDLGTTTVALVGIYAVGSNPHLSDVVSVFKHASEQSDKQIAYVHWGDEYEPVHNAAQERLAHALVDAGADAIVGHHPHVIQDVELYKNAPIFYSLGNFVFDQYFSEEVQTGLLLEFDIQQDLVIDLHPVTSIGSRSVPRFASEYEKEQLLTELAKKSSAALQEMIKNGSLTLDF